MKNKINILPLSDIHSNIDVLDFIQSNNRYNPDLITISGDIWERQYNLEYFVDYMNEFQRSMDCPIVMIQGNHDFWDRGIFNKSENIHVIHNSGIELLGLKIWGSPYTPPFFNWNHMLEDGPYGLDNIFKEMMPDELDILLSHGPPKGYCDMVKRQSKHLGSISLYDGILLHKPRYVFCGHIHTGNRKEKIIHMDSDVSWNESCTMVYNVSVLDENYNFMVDNPAPDMLSIS